MATTLQQIQDRAVGWSVANGSTSLVSDRPLVIARLAAIERALFDRAKELNSYYYAVRTTAASSVAASDRTLDLTAVATATAPVRRLLELRLPSGTQVNQVDLRDLDAELSPRFFLRGRTIVEVGSEWGTSGAVTLTLDYMRGPAVLDTAGALSQTITLEDEYADLMELEFAWFLAHSDVGRDTPEIDRLERAREARLAQYDAHLQSFGGEPTRRFNLPVTRSQR